MTQMTKGLRLRASARWAAEVIEELERLKWLLWHGNVFRALQTGLSSWPAAKLRRCPATTPPAQDRRIAAIASRRR